MKTKNAMLYFTGCAAAMAMLILDAKAAVAYTQAGIDLCIRTVIPSLFPFFFLSETLTSCLTSANSTLLAPLRQALRIPAGSESLLLTGLIGGYPVGAGVIAQAVRAGSLSKNDGRRMLGFCSNAGPAFIFGITGVLFSNPLAPLTLWFLHIISALITGALLPGQAAGHAAPGKSAPLPPTAALRQALTAMANVCGWVILFQLLLGMLERWVLWAFPQWLTVAASGLLELTSGCLCLQQISSEGIRFICCAAFLAWGGVCVALQTASVTAGVGLGLYFPGKIIQCVLSVILAALAQFWLFPQAQRVLLPHFALPAAAVLVAAAFLLKNRKNCSSNLAVQDV